MNFLSLVFFMFVAILFLIYYVIPKKWQWIVLLIGSLGFYAYASWEALIVLGAETLVIYLGARLMEQKKDKAKKLLCCICILAAVLMLLLLKYIPATNEALLESKTLSPIISNLIMPLGISYYTVMIISYSVDVYREQIKAETNFARLLLFAFYFPSITQGPMNRYGELAPQFKEEHAYNSKDIFEGLIRFAWGAFKKLVIANRAAAFISAIYIKEKSTGALILLAFILTMFQLYADFSGCMDMACGISYMFGIKLPENFKQPLFSRSIQEFWRKWHITFGKWLKDYIFMPITMAGMFKSFIRKGKDRSEKKKRTKLVSIIALMIMWIVMGAWHGSGIMFIILGLYYGLLFIVTMLLEDTSKKFGKNHVKVVNNPLYKFWQQLRTFMLILPGAIIISANSFAQLKAFAEKIFTRFNIESLVNGTILKFDLDAFSLVMMALGLIAMLVVSIIEYNKNEKICTLVMKQKLIVRVIIYWVVIIMILLSLNISNTEFIYAQF